MEIGNQLGEFGLKDDLSKDPYVEKVLNLASDRSLFEKSPDQLLSLRKSLFKDFLSFLARRGSSGVYRIVPLKDMHLRSPVEPFDGRQLARDFVDIVYVRKEQATKRAAS